MEEGNRLVGVGGTLRDLAMHDFEVSSSGRDLSTLFLDNEALLAPLAATLTMLV